MFIPVTVFLCFVCHIYCNEKHVYKIGGIFSDEHQVLAFTTATEIVNKKYEATQMELLPIPMLVPAHNTLLSYNSACKLLEEGIIGLFGPNSIHSSPYIQSLCDLKEIPHIEVHEDLNMERDNDNTLVNIYPHPKVLSNVVFDLIEDFDWKTFIIFYGTNEDLLRVSSILEFNALGRTVVLRQLEIDVNNEIDGYRSMLTKVKLTGEKRFLLVCSLTILETVLKQLQEVGMMTDIYSYIIVNLDMHIVELQPFQYAGTNITGIRIVNPLQDNVIRTAGEIQKRKDTTGSINAAVIAAWKLKLEYALIVDAVHLFFETILTLIENDNMVITAKPIHCKINDNWAGGYTIINLMKTKTIKGLTGVVKFDNEGFRKDFIIDILELAPGGLLRIGNWNSTSRNIRLERMHKPQRSKKDNLFNKTLTVLITMSPPYAMLKEDTTALVGNDRYEGFCVDLIEELAKITKFNYTFTVQKDGANGDFNASIGQWNGMIGEVINRTADLAITDLTITSKREKVVDFTMPFMNLGISILYKKPEPVPPSLFMFVSPFSLSVWVMLGISYFVVSIAIFIMGRLSPREWQNPFPCIEEPEYLVNQFTIRNSLWFTIGALMQQGTELAPIAISIRTASGVWWFFVLIMVSSYTANLAAFLTVETFVPSFKTIDELAAQKEIKYGAKRSGATANYFRDSNVTSYKNIWKYMVNHPENMVGDNVEGVKKVLNENYAFLMESTTIEYETERQCSLAQVGGLLDDKGYGIAMLKESVYRNELSKAVLRLQETGVLTGLKIKWWKEKRGGGKCSKKTGGAEATALGLLNVGGVFLVLFIGAILGFIGSFAELIIDIYRKSKSKKLSFKEEFKKELKFFVQFKQNIKEVSDTNSDYANENKLIVQDQNGTSL